MLGFSPLAGAPLASTGDASESVSVAANNRLQISQVSNPPANLTNAISRTVVGFQPEATLFNTVVNGRKLGDINNDGSVNTNDISLALQWDNDNSLSLTYVSYISGPMNDYMIANFSSFGPAGIGLIFNSPTGVGTVGTGVTVETDQVIDVDNVGITATGVVDDVTVTEGTGVTVSLNNIGITATGVVGTVLIWSSIIPNQSPSFAPITPSQTPSFAPISPAQSASFAEIVPSQTSSWPPINPAPSTSWVKILAA